MPGRTHGSRRSRRPMTCLRDASRRCSQQLQRFRSCRAAARNRLQIRSPSGCGSPVQSRGAQPVGDVEERSPHPAWLRSVGGSVLPAVVSSPACPVLPPTACQEVSNRVASVQRTDGSPLPVDVFNRLATRSRDCYCGSGGSLTGSAASAAANLADCWTHTPA